jgi:hypothetical protein
MLMKKRINSIHPSRFFIHRRAHLHIHIAFCVAIIMCHSV